MISLPIYPTLSNEEVDFIIETLNNELISINKEENVKYRK